MRASDLRERMTLQKPVEVRTSTGGVRITWEDVDDEVWAAVTPLRGIQLFYAQQLQSPADTRITIRWRKNLHTGWRLVSYDDSQPYVIQNFPRDIGYKHKLYMLDCQMLQAG